VSDCEELVGVALWRWWGRDDNKCFQKQEKHIRPWVGWVIQIDWGWRMLQRLTERTFYVCLSTLVNCKLQCHRPLSEKKRLISFNLCLTCWLPCGTV